jgi:protein SCO1/2
MRFLSSKILRGVFIVACFLLIGWILTHDQRVFHKNQGWQVFLQKKEGTSTKDPSTTKLPPLEDRGGDFTLTGHQGKKVRLQDYRGKVVLLYFGYTTCPDACPLTLIEMKQIMYLLGEQATQVQPLFISFDPERDTPEKLHTYLGYFDPSFVGLTGTPEAIAQVAKQYQVFYIKEEVDSAAGYLFAHTTALYLIDQQGRLRQRYRTGTPVEQMVQDVQYLLTLQNM